MTFPTGVPSSLKKHAGPSSKLLAKGRVRKPAPPLVNTDTTSYDRTDPFLAFNVLLKLLSSLPSRMGGCQFKLTPEEHKLSLHLLNIIEPFVGLAPSKRTITRQPTEILDAIAFHVDSKQDLLSLSLSCTRLHAVVFPRHYEYRVIKCKVSRVSLWNHLIVHRNLARNVRNLHILDERSIEPEVFPSDILSSDTDLESTDDELGIHEKHERYLISALSKMSSLRVFSWSCNHSPISIDNIWPTLLKCHSLKEIEINDNLIFGGPSASTTDGEGEEAPSDATSSLKKPKKPTTLHNLKSVALRSTKHVYGSSKTPALSRVSGMLHNCPNLESVDITYVPSRSSQQPQTLSRPPADELLLYSRWPKLTALTLTNLRCSPTLGFDATASFLSAHAGIEVLHLDVGLNFINNVVGSALLLPENSLPRLRELKACKEIATAILACPSFSPRPLDTIKGVRLAGVYGGKNHDSEFLTQLRGFTASMVKGNSTSHQGIRRLELAGWNELDDARRLVECVPGLNWLDVGPRARDSSMNATAKTSTMPVSNAGEWANILSGCPDLAAFHGVRLFYEVSAHAAAAQAMNNTGGSNGVPAVISGPILTMADRSRMRKNDEVASLMAWKCSKLRRLDHWEEGGGKVVVLVRDGQGAKEKEKVRWEVRRVKQ